MPSTECLQANTDVLSSVCDGDVVVLLSVETSTYFAIERAGVRMWELLAEPTTPDAIGDAIAAEFNVPQEAARADALEFCTRLGASGLVHKRA